MYSVRLLFGAVVFALALLPWLGSMIINPYTTWGAEPEHLIYENAASSRYIAGIAVLLFIVSALFVYSKPDNRRGWKGLTFAVPLLFFAGTALARAIWIQFWVLD